MDLDLHTNDIDGAFCLIYKSPIGDPRVVNNQITVSIYIISASGR